LGIHKFEIGRQAHLHSGDSLALLSFSKADAQRKARLSRFGLGTVNGYSPRLSWIMLICNASGLTGFWVEQWKVINSNQEGAER
jgi:hypothetical protein